MSLKPYSRDRARSDLAAPGDRREQVLRVPEVVPRPRRTTAAGGEIPILRHQVAVLRTGRRLHHHTPVTNPATARIRRHEVLARLIHE